MRSGKPLALRLGVSVVALPLALAILVGCSRGDSGSGGKASATASIDRINSEIEEKLAQRDDVAEAHVRYVDDFEDPATSVVDITMAPGADAEALYEEGLRLVWQSRIEPLVLISVNVINLQDPQSGVSETTYLGEPSERDPIEEKYGPRPR